MADREGVLEGPMKTSARMAEWREKEISRVLADYPNLEAIHEGRVSGRVQEWHMVRVELARLVYAYAGRLKLPGRPCEHGVALADRCDICDPPQREGDGSR